MKNDGNHKGKSKENNKKRFPFQQEDFFPVPF